MQNKFKESKFYKSLKENRAVVVTAITLLIALAVIVAATAIANRTKPPVDTGKDTQGGTESTLPGGEKESESETEADADGVTDVVDMLPTFSLPVSGSLLKGHDAATQVFSNTMKDYRVHLGVDIATEQNAAVCAAADGTVSQIWEDAMMGYCVAVVHGGDACTIYKNLAETLPEGIEEGAEVKLGQAIGYVGESAMIEIAEEPHLHFEMTVGGIAVDPLEYFEEDAVATLAGDKNYEKPIEE